MALISISERTSPGPNGANATIRFDNGPLYPITISDPFSEAEEQQLEWYFEKHLEFPFKDQVKAQQCAESVRTYGEKLFQQVFRADADVYVEYQECVKQGLERVQIEIAGSPSFQRWHWEVLKDPQLERPLVLQATMIRKNLHPQNIKITLRPSTTINILVVTARPSGKRDISYRTISRPMVEALRTANVPVQIDILRPGTYTALFEHLRETTTQHGVGYYHVIHFDVHGALLSYEDYNAHQEEAQIDPHFYKDTSRYGRPPIEQYEGKKAFLAMEDVEDDGADLVEASELASLLIEHHIPIAMLNACQSGKQIGVSETSLGSRLVSYGVQMVLAMGYSVTVSAAELLMRTLYQQLFAKHDLATCIRYARQELYNRKERKAFFHQSIELEDWLLPVVYQNRPQQLTTRAMTPEETAAYYGEQAAREREQPREPSYGFVGRDVDILQLEKRLLAKRNIVLVRGMGGAGKTTLLQHLRTWWQTTGLVEHVFYFGYDERAWNRQQILDGIARKLLTPVQYTSFQPLPLDARQSMLAQRLRSERHLLILDNLESITGTQLAIQHTLSQEEQEALHRFLSALAGGKTLVLLGSRSSEDWLAEQTFADNIYDLPGLDSEAASMLAERILERNKATKYRNDANLLHLLKLLDGFPLALEVVLANLTRQTPTQILEALQAGNIELDKGDTQKKTESILRCIDYSHSNLSPEAQQLLLCLAPFTSVINQKFLEQYTEDLKQQPALAALPFEHWPQVIQEAQNWGLLSPNPDIPGYLRLQPVLPYFLRNCLNTAEQATAKAAIETAFRQYYDDIGDALYDLLKSKEPQERLLGQALTKLEYENLMTALHLGLDAQVSILNLYPALANYLDTTQEHRRGLALGEDVLKRLERYSQEKLTGEIGFEFAGIIDDVAARHLFLKHYAQAEAFYKRALGAYLSISIFDKATLEKWSAPVYHQLGMVAQAQRQWQQAEQYYQEALRIKVEYQDRYGQASTYHQLGRVAEEQRQWQQAEQYYQEALRIYVEYQDRHSQAKTYHQLGIVVQAQRQWEQAEQYYQEALRIFVEYQDHHSQAITYHQLGMVAGEQQQWEQAEQYYQEALHIRVEYQDCYEQADTYHELGIVAEKQRQWEQAEQYYQEALHIYVEYQDRYGQAGTYGQLGILAAEQQRWLEAHGYLLRALEIYVSYKDSYNTRITLHNLTRIRQAGEVANLPAVVPITEETEKWLLELLKENEEEKEENG